VRETERKGNLNAYYVTIFAKPRETATRIALFGRNEFTFASNSSTGGILAFPSRSVSVITTRAHFDDLLCLRVLSWNQGTVRTNCTQYKTDTPSVSTTLYNIFQFIWHLFKYCHVLQWLKMGFRLVIGFIDHLQVVTTINYNTIADLHNLQSLHTNLSLSSWIYNTGTIKVSLNHTLPMSLCYSTHKVFKSHVKSSQADFLYSSSTTNFPWPSPLENWLVPEPNEFCHLYSQGTDTHHWKHISRDHHPLQTRKTQPHLLLRVGPCLQCCSLATSWSNPLYFLIIEN
jgi:hypothetical protein